MPSTSRSRRLLAPLLLTVAVCAAGTAAAGVRSTAPRLEAPDRGEISLGARIPDRVVSSSSVAARLPSSWGGSFRTAAGEVNIQISSSYPQDPAVAQRWADFLGSLIHGQELSTVTVFLAPPSEVRRECGPGALACYFPGRERIVAPGEDPARNLSAEAVLMHEYGHHVANSGTNTYQRWQAVDLGTKRWSSHEQICAGVNAGRFFPGAQSEQNYRLNPGEGFAEAYRVLNERRSGRTETRWQIVDSVFYPDDRALIALEQDVLSPWTANRQRTIRGSFAKRGPKQRTYTLATPLDGNFAATLRAPRKARLRLAVLNPAGRVLRQTRITSSSAVASTTVCGPRSLRLRVTRLSGAGAFQLRVSTP